MTEMTCAGIADTAWPGDDDVGYEMRREQLLEDGADAEICPADCGGQEHDEFCQPLPERT